MIDLCVLIWYQHASNTATQFTYSAKHKLRWPITKIGWIFILENFAICKTNKNAALVWTSLDEWPRAVDVLVASPARVQLRIREGFQQSFDSSPCPENVALVYYLLHFICRIRMQVLCISKSCISKNYAPPATPTPTQRHWQTTQMAWRSRVMAACSSHRKTANPPHKSLWTKHC